MIKFKFLICLLSLSSMLFGDDYFLAIGNGAHRMKSTDGVNWQHHQFDGKPGHDQNDLKAIARGNGLIVVVGGFFKSNIFITKDGENWEKSNHNIGVLSGVVFENGRFYIFNEGGNMASSIDGIKWEKLCGPVVADWAKEEAKRQGIEKLKYNIRMWKYAGGTFVGAGDNGITCATKDFKEFSIQQHKPGELKRFALESNGKVFVAVDNNGGKYAYASNDGVNWKDITPPLTEKEKIKDIVFDGERFILKVQDYCLESIDGFNWKKINGATFPGTLIVTPQAYFSAGPWYAYTDKPKVSFDKGKTWKECKFPAPAAMRYVMYVKE
jgi:hypothetical protein